MAAADEGDRYVGTTCQTLVTENSNTWEVCDDQYDSMNVPGYRSHVLTATPTDGCPVLAPSVRLRASMQSIYGTQETISTEGPYCPALGLTVSGAAAGNVNVSVNEEGSGTSYLVFGPL